MSSACNFNCAGLLCGKCEKGPSLVLGSSQCKRYSHKYMALLFPFALAGVLLVILLFLLHLTVAAGTLHGLIFYANIVAANHASRTFWIGVMYNNGTPNGFIHHHFCSLDYCTSESKYDEQCKYNHSERTIMQLLRESYFFLLLSSFHLALISHRRYYLNSALPGHEWTCTLLYVTVTTVIIWLPIIMRIHNICNWV